VVQIPYTSVAGICNIEELLLIMDVSNHTLFMDAGGVNIFIGNVSTVGTT
jgi:hypothetical protein